MSFFLPLFCSSPNQQLDGAVLPLGGRGYNFWHVKIILTPWIPCSSQPWLTATLRWSIHCRRIFFSSSLIIFLESFFFFPPPPQKRINNQKNSLDYWAFLFRSCLSLALPNNLGLRVRLELIIRLGSPGSTVLRYVIKKK